jgi:16S rRNA (uracil1498-N3)-methyltransferase
MVGRGDEARVSTVLVPPGAGVVGATCVLDEDEAHHLRVRRVPADEAVTVRDGAGLVAGGRVRRRGDAWVVEIEQADTAARPAALVLAVGAGDRDRFAWLVEKASELGVTSVVPLETARTAGVATKLRGRHLEKLRRQALEAIKQSGSPWAVQVAEPVELDAFLASESPGLRWLADVAGQSPPATLHDEPVVVMIGPEGGLISEERERVLAAGYHPTRLGAHTLRFETAAVVAAGVVSAARLRGGERDG